MAQTGGAANLSWKTLLMPPPSEERESSVIRPFRVYFPQSQLDDLRRRVETCKWPEQETVSDDSQGVQLRMMQKLALYWVKQYDWRRIETLLNTLPHFVTRIDGLDIHFIHVRSKHPQALPLIITHGWPGSIIEQLKMIEPLTNPTTHGGAASDAFDVVIPSLPGYGFSSKPATTGWAPQRIARAWITLMRRLGYKRFVAQGGDWGSMVTDLMGQEAPPELLAIHNNMPATVPPKIAKALQINAPTPAGLDADEKQAYLELRDFFGQHAAYSQEMGKRPQTLYGIVDSPIGLAAWMLDHDKKSYELFARLFDGNSQPGGLTRDDVLDNITLYWLTNTGISSARLYWENKLGFFDPKGVKVPVAVSVFPDELYQAPLSWSRQAYPGLYYYRRLNRGGHFAAWEQPQLLAGELREAFRRFH